MNHVPVVVFALTLALAGCASTPAPDPSVPATFHVDVGFEDMAQGLEAEGFFPRSLVVNSGDSIVFTLRNHEAPAVSFDPPQLLPAPAGLQKPGDAFTVAVQAVGTFSVICPLHAQVMKATIIVNPPGTLRPLGDAEYRIAAEAQVKAVREKAADILAAALVPGPTSNTDGSRTWTVLAGVGSAADGIEYMRFLGGERLSIKTGDSVAFDMTRNVTGTEHTVTFPPGTPGSGRMIAGAASTPQVFTVTFRQPGTFTYLCSVHADEGMKGTIIVHE